MQQIANVAVFGAHDDKVLAQLTRCLTPEAAGGALMADSHYGYSMPVGGVVAYRNVVSPSGIGYDISCGLKAVKTNQLVEEIKADLPAMVDRIWETVAFGVGKTTGSLSEHPLFDDPTWTDVPGLIQLKRLAAQQLGTVGSGNHFVDLLEDEDGWLWVMAHFGSRGFGHKTATGFLNRAHGIPFDGRPKGETMDAPPTLLSLSSALGQEYWAAMQLAGRYAYAGRDAVVDTVLDLFGLDAGETVHNHHNYAWIERHFGEELVVVRKGATPNAPGQISAIGGSMGDISVIVEGLATDENARALSSTVHGAGRVMSRTQAAGKMDWKTRRRRGGAVTKEMMRAWLEEKGVVLRGAGTDESPHAYKRIEAVLAEHQGSIKIRHTLRPLGVCMAGENEQDEFND